MRDTFGFFNINVVHSDEAFRKINKSAENVLSFQGGVERFFEASLGKRYRPDQIEAQDFNNRIISGNNKKNK